ncbi:MAG: NAD+ synthase [Candidatus Adiutrix sp.]|jgi:NAD+ synthetase|nr:NAD+ synthase [Candidatus Adiutrix sp.]
MRCALLQINTQAGAIARNAELIAARAEEAAARQADIVLTPEMALTGCPPHDLLLAPAWVQEAEQAALALARRLAGGPALVLGTVGRGPDLGGPLFNQALFLAGGQITAAYGKRRLSTGGLFDETKYFKPGDKSVVVEFRGRRLALTIGEDLPPAEAPGAQAPPFDVLINISASPFTAGRPAGREDRLAALARQYQAHLLQVNLVGGNDELVFDGRGLWAGPGGEILARGRGFAEDIILIDLDSPGPPAPAREEFNLEAEQWRALTLGLADYCAKQGFRRAVLGLSGGIDSALSAALAVAALGPENVTGLLMPSPYSSSHSLTDAQALAANLKIKTLTLPISPIMEAYAGLLAAPFAGLAPDTTEENLQARIRGQILMAFANKFKALLINTGNKSEGAVGYCTIYGDSCGGLALIGDLYKTEVYSLCRWLNASAELIPRNILAKAPSAELKPGQTDQDSLPPYEDLDRILRGLVEERRGPADLASAGFDPAAIARVEALVRAAEFKRRQAPALLKISADPVGAGWRLPLAKD